MKKIIALLTTTTLLILTLPVGVYADPEPSTQNGTETKNEAAPQTDEAVSDNSNLKDNIVTTKHQAVIQGKSLSYTTDAGTMVLESGGKKCEMFFVSYTLDGADPSERPVTFAFNGGPGAGSYCIQFGCLGPRKADIDETGYARTLPAKIIDNENSVLDMTDLVFIDPVGTGYSSSVNEDEEEDFLGYNNDIRTVGDFIRQYINRYKRWGSKKYIAGESYGTTRAVGLCDYLAGKYCLYVNGLMLISSVNDFSAVTGGTGNDLPYALFVPTFAADAWYHGKLSGKYRNMKLEDYLEEVRTFVEKEYQPALFIGKKLTESDKAELAKKLSGYIGLSEDYILKNNLRIKPDDFCRELLSDDKLMVGRYDGRITGPVMSGSLDDGSSDPSSFSTDIALTNSYQEYVTNELNYKTDRPYIPVSPDVYNYWSFSDNNGLISQEDVVRNCMSGNPFLKVWVLCGYFDGATPFYSAEWVYNHVFLDEGTEKNLRFTHYHSGHMFYTDKESFDKFRKDAEAWYKGE